MADQKTRKLPDHPRSEELTKSREVQAEMVEELDANPTDYPPTPTQEENDAAKLGIPLEPEVPPDPPVTRKAQKPADEPGSYTTRDTTATTKK